MYLGIGAVATKGIPAWSGGLKPELASTRKSYQGWGPYGVITVPDPSRTIAPNRVSFPCHFTRACPGRQAPKGPRGPYDVLYCPELRGT